MPRSQRLRDGLKLSGLLSLLVVVGLTATACGRNSTGTSSRTPLVRMWRVNQSIDTVRQMAADFKENYPNIRLQYKEKRLTGYELASLKSLAARTGPDIWSIPDDWIGDHVSRIAPLPEAFFAENSNDKNPPSVVEVVKSRYPQGILDQIISVDGKTVYGLPTGVDSLQLYVNPEILGQATNEFVLAQGEDPKDEVVVPVQQLLSKAPATWTDLVDQLKYLVKRDGTKITRAGIALGAADNIPNSADVLQLLIYQNGGKIISSDHRNALFHIPDTSASGVNFRPGENALDFFTSFSRSDKPTYTWNPSMPQALDAFGQGKVAMVIAFSDFGRQLRLKYPRLEYETAPVPQISVAPLQEPVNLIRFNVEVVTKTADSQAAAFTFLKTYTSEGNANGLAGAYAAHPLVGPYKSTLEADTDTFLNRQVLTGKSVFKKSREEFDLTFREMVIDVTQNGLSVDKALDSGAEKINQLLIRDEE